MSTATTSRPRPRRVTFAVIAIITGINTVLTTTVLRLVSDVPFVLSGTIPDDAYARNYVLHPVSAVLHVLPGLVFLLGAPFQLSARFRRRHLTLHRRMGRVILPAGLVSAVFAIYVGVDHPYNGWVEGSASVVFGAWMLWCLGAAFVAIRRRDVGQHRRWMIRAFVIALGIASIRLWTLVFHAIDAVIHGTGMAMTPAGLEPLQESFGLAFWLGFSTHALFAEWWLGRPPARPASA